MTSPNQDLFSTTMDTLQTRLTTPVVMAIINELSMGVFPTCFEHYLIRPLLKKQDLDQENLQNDKTIANIPFLCKVTEKAVVFQVNLYLETNKLIPPYNAFCIL